MSSEGGPTPSTSSLVSCMNLNEVKASLFRTVTLLSLEGVEQLASQASQVPTVAADTEISTALQDMDSEADPRTEQDSSLMMHSSRSSAENRGESPYSTPLAETGLGSNSQHRDSNAAEASNSQFSSNDSASIGARWLAGLFHTITSWLAVSTQGSQSLATTPTLASAESVAEEMAEQCIGQTCVICQNTILRKGLQAPCGHFYDIKCILDLFRAATVDETLFPPRCCKQRIDLPTVKPHMGDALLSLFEAKSLEFGTLKRVYCASPTCSSFLGPQTTGPQSVTCPNADCKTRTCSRCKTDAGIGALHFCQPDSSDAGVLALGQSAGWVQCPGCEQMIELEAGCHHMTCRCKTEFCYLCRARWKTCSCNDWDERRLHQAAEARVDALFGREVAPTPELDASATKLVQPASSSGSRADALKGLIQAVRARKNNREEDSIQDTTPGKSKFPPSYEEAMASLDASLHSTAQQKTVTPTTDTSGSDATLQRGKATSYADTTECWQPAGLTPNVPSSSTSTGIPVERSIFCAPIPISQPEVSNPSTRRVSRDMNRTRVHEYKPATHRRRQLTTEERMDLVIKAIEELRHNHECVHSRWIYRHGPGKCENCRHRLPLYLFRCYECQIRVCNRCRRNRL